MEGPKNAREARQAQLELAGMLTAHKALCFNCNTGRVCPMVDLYDRSIAAAAGLAEAAKVVDGDGQEA